MTKPTIPDEIREQLSEPLARLGGLDPVDVLIQANASNQALLEAQSQIAALRRAAVRDLRITGWTLKQIAQEAGMTEARVYQIESGWDRKEKKARQEKKKQKD